MKNIFKHLFSFILFIFVIVVTVSCGESVKDVKITINVPDQIYVDETVDFNYDVNVDEFSLVELKSSNDDIILITGTKIKGVASGNAEVSIVILYNEKEYSAKKEIEVKKESNYELEVSATTELLVGEVSEVEVFEKNTATEIVDFKLLSKNENVVEIVDNKIKAKSVGNAVVVVAAAFDGVNLSKEINIIVSENAEAVLGINLPSKIYNSQLFVIEVTYLPENVKLEEFAIESSNIDIFEYYPEDLEAQSYGVGEVILTITATYKDKEYKQKVKIEIVEALSLEISLSNEITTKGPVEFKAYLNPGNIEVEDYTIFSTNTKAFTVEKGKVTPVGIGKGLISLSCQYDGATFTASHNLNVVRYYPEKLESNIQNLMFLNEELDVSAFISPTDVLCEDFSLSTSNNAVISVDEKKIKANALGEATITISSGELKNEYKISVVEFGGIKLEIENEISLNQVVSYKVIATPSNKEIKNYIYSSNNETNILINNGLIFGAALGTSQIKVSYSYNGSVYDSSVEVEVQKIEYPIERLYIVGSNGILVGTTTELTVNKYPSVGVGEVLLSSENTNIATVEGNKVTGVSEGKTNIVAVVDGSDVKAKFEITVIKKNDISEINNAIYEGNPLTSRYYEESISLYNELMGGIIQTTYVGYTSTQINGDEDGYSGLDGTIVADKYYQQQVHLLEVPSSQEIKVIPWANLDNNKWSLTTVRGLIEHYEKNNPGYRVIAAVNGDFFDINANKNLPYSTTGENISDGEFYKTSNIFGSNGGTLGFTNDGSTNTLVGGAHAVRNSYMTLAIYDNNGNIVKEFKVQKFNEAPLDNETSVYYGNYDSDKNYVAIDSLEENTWVVKGAELALPSDVYDFYGKGVITSTSKTTLEIGDFAITSNDAEVKKALAIGVKIRVQFEFDANDKFANVTSATGYNGVIFDETHSVEYTDGNLLSRAPRTVIGMKADGTLVMMVVDGRQGAFGMYGCDGYELAAIMKAYGCVKAYNVDGGGSSTMVIRTDSGLLVTNSPSDGRERSDGNCILICVADPSYQTEITNLTSSSATVKVSSPIADFNNKELYISLDNEFYPVVDGKVEFTNLFHNTDYNYRVYYKENDKYIATQSVGVIKTYQSNFRFLGLTIEETDDAFIIHSYSDDIDKCGNIHEMAVNINDYYVYLKQGSGKVSKKSVGNKILSIFTEYWYMEGGERQNIIDEDPVYFLIK